MVDAIHFSNERAILLLQHPLTGMSWGNLFTLQCEL